MKYKREMPGFIILYHPLRDLYYIGATRCIENYAAMMRSYLKRTPQRFFGSEEDVLHVEFMMYRTETFKIACQVRNQLLAHPVLDRLGVFTNRYRRIKSRTRKYKAGKRVLNTMAKHVANPVQVT